MRPKWGVRARETYVRKGVHMLFFLSFPLYHLLSIFLYISFSSFFLRTILLIVVAFTNPRKEPWRSKWAYIYAFGLLRFAFPTGAAFLLLSFHFPNEKKKKDFGVFAICYSEVLFIWCEMYIILDLETLTDALNLWSPKVFFVENLWRDLIHDCVVKMDVLLHCLLLAHHLAAEELL